MPKLTGPAGLVMTLAVGGAVFTGCSQGKIGEPASDFARVGSAGGDSNGGPAMCTTAGTPSRIRRFTRSEFETSVSDLLGEELHPAKDFPLDSQLGGYTNQADALVVSPLLAESLSTAAQSLAALAVGKLDTLAPCAAAADDACAHTFIADFARRAYRRPLLQEESDELFNVYVTGKDGADFKAGIALMLEVVFQSPNFIYKTEIGDGSSPAADGTVPLSPYEIAAELSYLVSGRAPDADLLAAAEAGTLGDAMVRETHARRLLDTAQARTQLANFVGQWIGIDRIEQADKDKTLYSDWSVALAAKMRQETDAFAQNVIFDGDGMLSTLLTAPYTFVDDTLAKLYNLPSQGQFGKVMLDTSQRSGILTHGSVLATFAQSTQDSPVRRGKFVRTRVLCENIPPPPKNLMIMPPPVTTINTTRDRFKAHATGACYDCHKLMDPIGFGFENFDAIGRYRTTDNDFPVDASGEITDSMDANGKFKGVVELAAKLSKSAEVRACFTKNWFQFAMARGDRPSDSCTIDSAFGGFNAGTQNIKDLVIDIVRAPEFALRIASAQ